jgi:hypothetical protein
VTSAPASAWSFSASALLDAVSLSPEGQNPQWLSRWNDPPGTVGIGRIEGASLARAKKLLWARDASTTIAADLPAATGDGRILFIQLVLQRRVDRSKPNYDPVAERILLDLLGCF